MHSDIDQLMEKKDIDILIVKGPSSHNPDMYYFTKGAQFTDADIIKVRGKDPILFCGTIEGDEAKKTGLQSIFYSRYPDKQLLDETNNDWIRSLALRYQKMLADVGSVSGNIALFGQVHIGKSFNIFNELCKLDSHFQIAPYDSDDILELARAAKEPYEVERIRSVGRKTVEIVDLVSIFLSSHQAKDNLLVKFNGEPLTVGDVKNKIEYWLMERGLENPMGMIFAIGSEAGNPHNPGTESLPIPLGVPIVFDFYPCERGGGYCFDMTRTWCIGYAPDEVLEVFNQVDLVYNTICSNLEINTPFSNYQQLACEMFEKLGHKTVMNNPETQEGYVHSLGHGVGLYVHERPYSSLKYPFKDLLKPGMIFTVEPGLYYPEKRMGIRLEDTFWVTPEGKFERLIEYSRDLILPVKDD